MQSLVGVRSIIYECEKSVKTEVKGSHDWLESEEREAPKETVGNQKEPSSTASGRDPSSKIYREAGTNGSVPGFRGS